MKTVYGVRLVAALVAGAVCVGVLPPLAIAQSAAKVDVKGLPDGLVLKAPPAGPIVTPAQAKKTAKVGDKITITGRVGGGAAPFVKDRGVFTIVGEELANCSDAVEDHCPQPWDYCCETKTDIVRNSATIQVNTAKGKLIKLGMKGKAGLAEASEVTVTGVVTAVDEKTLVVTAESMYVAPALPHGWCYNAPPASSKTPAEARGSVKVGDDVVVRGRVGGSEFPMAIGRASFTLVGPEVAFDEKAEKPWAYAGVAKETLDAAMCTVQFVDDKGEPLVLELAGRSAVAKGNAVVVSGKVLRTDGGLVIAATKVQPEKK
jgi:hypothetical protein